MSTGLGTIAQLWSLIYMKSWSRYRIKLKVHHREIDKKNVYTYPDGFIKKKKGGMGM
jgi:hypothetical protein